MTESRRSVVLLVLLPILLIGCAVETGMRGADPVATEPADPIAMEPAESVAVVDPAVVDPAIIESSSDAGAGSGIAQQESEVASQDASQDENPLRVSLYAMAIRALEWSANGVRVIRTRLNQALNILPQISSTQQIMIVASATAIILLIAVVFSTILI